MESSIKQNLLKCIGKVYEHAAKCKLESIFFEKIDNELCQLSKYFNTSKQQSFFIAMVFALNYKGDCVDLKDLMEYFDCNPMKILEYNEDFETLIADGILCKEKSSHRMKLARTNDQFIIKKYQWQFLKIIRCH